MAQLLLQLLLLTLTLSLTQSSADPTAKTYIVRVDSSSKPSIFPTHHHWYAAEFTDSSTILHTYHTVFHGFSALLTPSKLAAIRRHPSVLIAFEDRRRNLHTTRSPQFLGLRNQHGLWSESDYGSDVIIGVFDTGIWPERRSFSDHNLGPVPRRWKGTCQTGTRFSASNCNRKIIGARFFVKGHEAAGTGLQTGINETVEFKSPRDADGHGTHTASTAAGRHVYRASMEGYAAGIAKGVAPKARLAVYKVCWKDAGCFDSDILAAFDAAADDGVDVISISIGGGDGISSPYELDPIAIGSYGAVSRGIFVSSSAGNDGPNEFSVINLAPWLTTVGAGTIDRNFPADVIISGGGNFSGVSLYAGKPLNSTMYPLVYAGKSGLYSAAFCLENSLDPNLVRGKIVICDRGSSTRVEKGLVVKKAGGVGMILVNAASSGDGLIGDAHLIPTCAVGATAGDRIKAYLATNPKAKATINFRGTVIGTKPAPVVASFSARGPNSLNLQILKPDLIAPGVNILAAWTEAAGPTGLASDTRKTEFNILSGTSMSCPHVSGAAALLKSAHPDWSPAMIRSAMMTTASVTDNSMNPMIDEGSQKPATPYDYGAGILNLELAMDPGLVYELTNDDYVSFLCGTEFESKTIQVITRTQVNCPMRRALPENLNYPSVAALFPTRTNSQMYFRMVTNVGEAKAVYRVRVDPPKGVEVVVRPRKLVFSDLNRKLGYYVNVTVVEKNSGVEFGSVIWEDGKHVVRIPVVVTQTYP